MSQYLEYESETLIGANRVAMVTISKNDNANGVLKFSKSVLNVTEDYKGGMINVTRRAGSFGQVYYLILFLS